MPRVALAVLVFLGVSSAPLIAEQTCQVLMSLALEHATITSATAVPEGPVSGGGRGGPPVIARAHCAVQGIIRPTKDSEIHFELWIPANGWNGKYLQLGNGGWEAGVAPDKIIATGTVAGDTSKALTRPLCPYPQVARYDRTGDPNNAASFACVAPQVP